MTQPSNPFADDPQPAGALRLQSAGDPLDPYAAPAAPVEPPRSSGPGIGMWRDGEALVIHSQATFPHRCIYTNEPTEIRRRQKLSWSYAIDVTHRQLPLEFGVCEARQRQIARLRGQRTMIALACFTPGFIALVLISLGYVSCVALIVVAVSLLASAIAFERAWNVGDAFQFRAVKSSYFWLKGAQPPFLNSLPEWPGLG